MTTKSKAPVTMPVAAVNTQDTTTTATLSLVTAQMRSTLKEVSNRETAVTGKKAIVHG